MSSKSVDNVCFSQSMETLILENAAPPHPALRRIATLIGSPRPASPTHALARTLSSRLAGRIRSRRGHEVAVETVDLALDIERATGEMPQISLDQVEAIERSELVVVASPIRRGAYTWLLKRFFDELPSRALRGKIAIPLMVAPAPRHALTADLHLRPLLIELGASCPTPALFALEQRLVDCDALVSDWLDRSAPALSPYLA
jgi:FMN reductase